MRRGARARAAAQLATVLLVAAVGAGCASGDAAAPTGEVATIDITVADGEVTPSGTEVQVSPGQEVELVVTADAPGEIHVHSDPETTFTYQGSGEPETFSLAIDRPGQVEVESHTLDKLIVELVVS